MAQRYWHIVFECLDIEEDYSGKEGSKKDYPYRGTSQCTVRNVLRAQMKMSLFGKSGDISALERLGVLACESNDMKEIAERVDADVMFNSSSLRQL